MDREFVMHTLHAELDNLERLLSQGFQLLMARPSTNYERLELGLKLAGRT